MTKEDFYRFKDLVYDDSGQTELECGKFLKYAAGYLVPKTMVSLTIEAEYRNYFGSSDYIFSAKTINDQNVEEICAYVWELKAPQCYLFEIDDNKNRCRPTKDFVKAENQLLHYLYSAVNDDLFRSKFRIMHSSNIKAGGIIIGRSEDRLVSKQDQDGLGDKARMALEVRQNMLYKEQGIRICTWDRILRFVEPPNLAI